MTTELTGVGTGRRRATCALLSSRDCSAAGSAARAGCASCRRGPARARARRPLSDLHPRRLAGAHANAGRSAARGGGPQDAPRRRDTLARLRARRRGSRPPWWPVSTVCSRPTDLAKLDFLRLPPPPAPVREPGLLFLPRPYVVPGGRFNEMYGWDSSFIVMGLLRDGQTRAGARHGRRLPLRGPPVRAASSTRTAPTTSLGRSRRCSPA